MDEKQLYIAEGIKPILYNSIEEAVADASAVWVRNIDTIVAKAIIENNITDVTQITLIQKNGIDGIEFSVRIKENAKVNPK